MEVRVEQFIALAEMPCLVLLLLLLLMTSVNFRLQLHRLLLAACPACLLLQPQRIFHLLWLLLLLHVLLCDCRQHLGNSCLAARRQPAAQAAQRRANRGVQLLRGRIPLPWPGHDAWRERCTRSVRAMQQARTRVRSWPL